MAKSPEERTVELFSQNYTVLGRELRNRTVTIPGTETSIVLMELKPYSLAENQKSWLYSPMQQMEEGDFWARYHPLRKMCLSLIVAWDEGSVGACIQVVKANRIDPERGIPVPMPKQGDIANYLGLRQNEIGRLRFLDETETLYLIPTGQIMDKLPKIMKRDTGTQDADRALGRLLNPSLVF